jgi:hypothetical protein
MRVPSPRVQISARKSGDGKALSNSAVAEKIAMKTVLSGGQRIARTSGFSLGQHNVGTATPSWVRQAVIPVRTLATSAFFILTSFELLIQVKLESLLYLVASAPCTIIFQMEEDPILMGFALKVASRINHTHKIAGSTERLRWRKTPLPAFCLPCSKRGVILCNIVHLGRPDIDCSQDCQW